MGCGGALSLKGYTALKLLGLRLFLPAVSLALALSLAGCSTVRGSAPASRPAETADHNDRRLGHARWSTVLLYPVNRVIDLFDVARFGVNVGPGMGIDAQASDLARAAAIYDTSVGVGFQGLRRLPVCARSRSEVALGPVRTPPTSALGWHGQFWDVGLEAYVFLIGAHAYVNPKEFLDFFGGWVGFDPMRDDLEMVF
jgi:hypothetical protein